MSFEDWVRIGYEQGFCGPPVCHTHDGVPTSAEEDALWDDGDDPCVHVLRLYDSPQTKAAVEDNHSPSVWRATNAGLTTSD